MYSLPERKDLPQGIQEQAVGASSYTLHKIMQIGLLVNHLSVFLVDLPLSRPELEPLLQRLPSLTLQSLQLHWSSLRGLKSVAWDRQRGRYPTTLLEYDHVLGLLCCCGTNLAVTTSCVLNDPLVAGLTRALPAFLELIHSSYSFKNTFVRSHLFPNPSALSATTSWLKQFLEIKRS
jgi:hypothetical protein